MRRVSSSNRRARSVLATRSALMNTPIGMPKAPKPNIKAPDVMARLRDASSSVFLAKL
jgi:hypothetical protein